MKVIEWVELEEFNRMRVIANLPELDAEGYEAHKKAREGNAKGTRRRTR